MVFFKDLFAEAMKLDAIKFFRAQYQRKDGKEAKFVNFSREKQEFPTFRASAQQNSHEKREEETEVRISCSSGKCQVPRKSQISSLLC